MKVRAAQQDVPEDPKIPFVSPTGEIDVSYLDPDVRDMASEYAKGRKALDDTLRPLVQSDRPDIDVVVRQYFVDEFSTGEFFDNLATRLAESGRAVPTLPSYAANYAASAVEAMQRTLPADIPVPFMRDPATGEQMTIDVGGYGTSFSDNWNALAPKREKMNMDVLRQIDEFIPAPTLAMGMNDSIRERAKKELSPEQYEDFAFITAEDGSKIERVFITDEAAYEIVEEAFSQMSKLEQFGVMLGEGYLGGGILAKTKNKSAANEVNRLIQTRKRLGYGEELDLSKVPAILRQERLKTKVDDDLLNLGLYNRDIAARMDEAKVRIKDLKQQMKQVALDPKKGKGHIAYKRLQSEAANLQRMRNRNFLNTKISPYMQEVVAGEVTLALGGVIGRNQLEGYMGMDGDTGELFGVLGGLGVEFTGIRKLTTKTLGKATTSLTGITLAGGDRISTMFTKDATLNPVSALFRKLTQQDMTVDDYEKLYYKPANKGKPMSRQERKSLVSAFKQVEDLDPEAREEFIFRLESQMNLENRLLSMFDEGLERDQAAKFLSQSFAETTALPQAMATYQMAVQKAQMEGIKKNGLGAMVGAAAEMERKVSKAQFLLNKFEEHAAKFGNPKQLDAARELIQTSKNVLLRNEEMVAREMSKLEASIDSMVQSAVTDITEPLDETFLEDYLEAKDFLAQRTGTEVSARVEGAVSDVLTTQQAIRKTEAALLERFQTIAAIRDRQALHSSSLETAVEALVYQRQGKLAREMDLAYEGFRDFVAETDRPNIDLSPAVEKMMDLANVEGRDISIFFGPESAFFSGYLGRKSRKMFERMVQRTLKELPEDERQELFSSLVEEGVDAEDLEALLQNNPTQFGLFLHQHGKLDVFARANIEEAEEFRRAFRDYGYKTSNKAVSRQFNEFQELIDESMEASDPEGYEQLLKVRKEYQQLNDPTRPGSPMARILASKTGDKVTDDTSGLSGMYKNVTPMQVMGEMGDTVADLMSGTGNKFKNTAKLKRQIGSLAQSFGTPTEHGMAIDLRTEEGLVTMDLMEELISAIVYDKWAGDFLQKRPSVGAKIGDPRFIGFRQTVMDELEGINEAFNVKVVDRDGNLDESLVFNITDMIAKEQDIAKVIMKGAKHHAAGKKAVAELSRSLKLARDDIRTTADIQRKANEDVMRIAGVSDPLEFYEQYISGLGDIDIARDNFMSMMIRTEGAENADAYAKMFDAAIYNSVYQALLTRGGYGPVGTKASAELQGLLGEGITINGFSNTLGALAELENPNVLRNLEKIMDREHIENMRDILQYLANQNAAQAASMAMLNNKGMTANEAISRAYNIARGMVSPAYVMTEVSLRLLTKHNADIMLLGLQNKDAARIMHKMLTFPKKVTGAELNAFDTLVKEFLFTNVAQKGQELALEDYFDTYLQEEKTNEDEQ